MRETGDNNKMKKTKKNIQFSWDYGIHGRNKTQIIVFITNGPILISHAWFRVI